MQVSLSLFLMLLLNWIRIGLNPMQPSVFYVTSLRHPITANGAATLSFQTTRCFLFPISSRGWGGRVEGFLTYVFFFSARETCFPGQPALQCNLFPLLSSVPSPYPSESIWFLSFISNTIHIQLCTIEKYDDLLFCEWMIVVRSCWICKKERSNS